MKSLTKYSILLVTLFVTLIFSFSAVLTVKADADTIAPVISVSDTTVRTYAGSEPVLNVTATDDTDGEVEVVFVWSDNALDGLGYLTNGEHTCTVSATDSSANTSTVTITYIVTEDTAENSGYAFVTIVCEGMDTMVKAYALNATIDMSAYLDREGYTKTVKNSAGDTVTNFTATNDCTLYVIYTEILPDVTEPDNTEPDVPAKMGCASAVVGAMALPMFAVLGTAVINLCKNKGNK